MSRANEPAYPVPNDANVNDQMGLTIREHYAGLAMQGILAANYGDPGIMWGPTAAHAVQLADALIAELAKPKENRLDEYGNEVSP